VEAGALDALAAHHTIHICNQKVNVQNLRMFLKERVRFVKLNGTRGYRHDATPLLLKISIIGLAGPVNRKGMPKSSQPHDALKWRVYGRFAAYRGGHYPLFSC
jgi:hypothetical protein